jgi:hypothetical protein
MSEHVVRLIEKLGDDEESAIDDLQAAWSEMANILTLPLPVGENPPP